MSNGRPRRRDSPGRASNSSTVGVAVAIAAARRPGVADVSSDRVLNAGQPLDEIAATHLAPQLGPGQQRCQIRQGGAHGSSAAVSRVEHAVAFQQDVGPGQCAASSEMRNLVAIPQVATIVPRRGRTPADGIRPRAAQAGTTASGTAATRASPSRRSPGGAARNGRS